MLANTELSIYIFNKAKVTTRNCDKYLILYTVFTILYGVRCQNN